MMPDLKIMIGDRIRSIRKMRGLTQAQLGELAGTKFSYIGDIERGRRNVSLNTLEKIMVALGVDSEQFFRFSEMDIHQDKLGISGTLAIHVSYLKGRNPEEIKLVHRIAKDMLETFEQKLK